MAHPHPSDYQIPEDTPLQPKPDGEDWDPCPECGAIGTVPVRKPDPDDPLKFLDERFDDHSRGSAVCPTCKHVGWVTGP